MTLDLFAEIPVTDYPAALAWYERFFGYPPAFAPHDKESVWELAEHRYVVVVQLPERAGHALTTIFVDDLDSRIGGITERGLAPTVAANFKIRDCAPANRMITALAPLPPRNAAAAFVAFWQMSHADRKDQKDILPICPYGQK